jgi:hypothetical protein
MNNNNKDGGPAFPLSPEVGKFHFDDPFAYPGMSLRDYFAGQALVGVISNSFLPEKVSELSKLVYTIADAMIAERSKS